eukprot:9669649-Lingulodinium_polyedra.AAC.1
MDYVKVYEDVMVSDLTPEQLHCAVGVRFLSKWKGNIVKSRLLAQGYNQKVGKDDTDASTPLRF